MSIAKIQKGDRVKVIAGNYKGTVGIVSKVINKKLPKGGVKTRVAISELPKIVDYRRSMKMYKIPGEMRLKDRLIDVSNVQLVTDDGQVSRVAIEVIEGKKVRVYKKTGQKVEKVILQDEQSKDPQTNSDSKTKNISNKKSTKSKLKKSKES